MSKITYLAGDATRPVGDGLKIIAHICNDRGGWGRGFVLAISRRWSKPEAEYRNWFQERASSGFRLGAVQLVRVDDSTWVANMIAQAGTRATVQGPPIRYVALRGCLAELATKAVALKASVHMPRIGCGLAGGSWTEVEPIIAATLCAAQCDVYVYDFGQAAG